MNKQLSTRTKQNTRGGQAKPEPEPAPGAKRKIDFRKLPLARRADMIILNVMIHIMIVIMIITMIMIMIMIMNMMVLML